MSESDAALLEVSTLLEILVSVFGIWVFGFMTIIVSTLLEILEGRHPRGAFIFSISFQPFLRF